MNRGSVLGRGSFCLVTSLTLAFACGDDKGRPPPAPISGGASGTGAGGFNPFGGASGMSGAGGGTEGGPRDPLAPDVSILTPEAVSDPNAGVVLTPLDSEAVKVVCRASQSKESGAKPVRSSTVKIRVLDAKDMEVATAAGAPNGNVDEFEAEFPLGMVATGRVTFHCIAEDQSTPPKPGEDRKSTFVDHGPKIEVLTPARDAAVALKGTAPFSFKVLPAQLADGDMEAAVSKVSLHVRQQEIKNLVENPPGSGTYIADVNFEDPMLFSPTPTGEVAVNISATNSRTPQAAREDAGYGIKIDSVGPTIEITSHPNLDVVTGLVTLTFKVTDALSGVDYSSVVVTLDQTDHGYDPNNGLWNRTGDTLSFTFDSEAKERISFVQIQVVIRAKDRVGNPSLDDAATRLLYRDDQPPSVDLDPAPVREHRIVTGTARCSNAFDPLGEAVNDEAQVWNARTFRALFWDETNELPGASRHYFMMDPNSVPKLYIQTDASKPLLKDTDGDAEKLCDTVDTMGAAQEFELMPVAVTGSAWWGTETTEQPPMQGCTPQGLAPPSGGPLCNGNTVMTRVIRHQARLPAGPPIPVVYGIAVAAGPNCTGAGIDLKLFGATEGQWVCLVARGVDRGQNVGFSRPLRVCYDDPANGANPCPAQRPSCTDGCKAPPQVVVGDTYGVGIIPE